MGAARRRLNGWQRLGVVISVGWVIVAAVEIADDYDYAKKALRNVGDSSRFFDLSDDGWSVVSETPMALSKEQAGSSVQSPPATAPAGGNFFDQFDDPATPKRNSSAGLFDDLIPKKEDNAPLVRVVPEWSHILTFAFAPILALWAIAYVGVFAVRWVVDGFRSG